MTLTRKQLRTLPRRQAFTLIELMTVIAITLILIGLFFAGMKHWNANAARATTLERMQLLNGMLAELDAAGHNQLQNQPFMTSLPEDATLIGSMSRDAMVVAGTSTQDYLINSNPNSPKIGWNNLALAVDNTSNVMQFLTIVPDNAKNLAKLPSSVVAPYIIQSGVTPPPTPAPVVLDGWGNPIIFVPPSGLSNVQVNVDSTIAAYKSTGNATLPQSVTIQSPDGRPFWASAGPDGDFIRGDDNIYSFQGQ